MAQLEVKKMKQGMSYSCKEKTIILNVFKYFRSQFPDICVTEIVRRTSKATGCSEKSIFQFRKEEASAEGFKAPSTTKIRKHININSRDIKYDSAVRQGIRDIIYDLKYKNIVPSLNTILKHVNGDPLLPNFSLMTLRRLLFDMGFCYEKNGNKSILVEKDSKDSKKSVVQSDKKLHPKFEAQDVQKNTPVIMNNAENLNTPQQAAPVNNIQQHQVILNSQQMDHIQPSHRVYSSIHDNMNHLSAPHMNPHHYNPPMYHHHASNMNMHLKQEIQHWIHHPPPHLMKQE